jgi:hypothetical protein
MDRCEEKTKKGMQCKRKSAKNSIFCSQHGNTKIKSTSDDGNSSKYDYSSNVDQIEKNPCFCNKHGSTKCCWCSEKRNLNELSNPSIYVDRVGQVRPSKFGIKCTRDISYCPTCKMAELSGALINALIKKKMRK